MRKLIAGDDVKPAFSARYGVIHVDSRCLRARDNQFCAPDDVKEVQNFVMAKFEKDQNVWPQQSPMLIIIMLIIMLKLGKLS